MVSSAVGLAGRLVPGTGPSRQRTGVLAHIHLGVAVAGAECEQLLHLARIVLVRVRLGGARQRQPDQHRRVDRDRREQLGEAPKREAALGAVLVDHQPLGVDALVAGREPVVPGERHPLDQLVVRADHAVEPPAVVVAPDVVGLQRLTGLERRQRAGQPAARGPRE